MVSAVNVVEVQPCPLATIRGQADRTSLSKVIRQLFDRFYAAPPKMERGLNVVLYHGNPAHGTTIDVGVQALSPFEPSGDVIALSTPGGTAATVTHLGPYERLGEAYEAILAWLAQNGREPGEMSWEVYGHWTDNQAELRTDIYFLLRQ